MPPGKPVPARGSEEAPVVDFHCGLMSRGNPIPSGGGENPAAVALSQALMPSRVQGDGIGRERVESP